MFDAPERPKLERIDITAALKKVSEGLGKPVFLCVTVDDSDMSSEVTAFPVALDGTLGLFSKKDEDDVGEFLSEGVDLERFPEPFHDAEYSTVKIFVSQEIFESARKSKLSTPFTAIIPSGGVAVFRTTGDADYTHLITSSNASKKTNFLVPYRDIRDAHIWTDRYVLEIPKPEDQKEESKLPEPSSPRGPNPRHARRQSPFDHP